MSAPANKRSYTRKPKFLHHNVPLSNILLTNAEAAKYLRIGIKQLKYYRDNELLPFIQMIGIKPQGKPWTQDPPT